MTGGVVERFDTSSLKLGLVPSNPKPRHLMIAVNFPESVA
jgi:hypothetical protein